MKPKSIEPLKTATETVRYGNAKKTVCGGDWDIDYVVLWWFLKTDTELTVFNGSWNTEPQFGNRERKRNQKS